MAILYRKYRPQKFSDFFGQEHLVETLLNEITKDKLAHAYLFSGPRGTGKTSLARLFAKAVNCVNRKDNGEPCNECTSCQEISESRNLDVIEMDAASHTGVDNVRENIIDNAQFKPTKSPYKIFIIDEVHMLSTSAFNALLKTLEEPPKHAIFILATTEWHKIPATIISRCQRFNFKKIPSEKIKKKLKGICSEEGIKVDDEVLQKVIAKADGCLRDAESLLGQLFSLGTDNITLETAEMFLPNARYDEALKFLENSYGNNPAQSLEVIKELINAEVSFDDFAGQIIEMLRKIMIAKTDSLYLNNLDFDDETKKRMRKITEDAEMEKIVRDLENAIKRKSEIKTSPLPQLPLEILAIEISGNFSVPLKNNPPAPSAPIVEKKIITETKAPEEFIPVIENTPTEKKATEVVAPKIEVTETVISSEPAALNEIKSKWDEFLKEVTEVCPSLVFILNTAEPRAVNDNNLSLAVGFSFHKEKLEQPVNRQKLEDCFKKAMGKNISFSCEVDENVGKPVNELDDLALSFGGEVV